MSRATPGATKSTCASKAKRFGQSRESFGDPRAFVAAAEYDDYRAWAESDYELYDALAPELHELGILVEPDSREPWFICEAHDVKCLAETLDKFERALDITMTKLPAAQKRANTA